MELDIGAGNLKENIKACSSVTSLMTGFYSAPGLGPWISYPWTQKPNAAAIFHVQEVHISMFLIHIHISNWALTWA